MHVHNTSQNGGLNATAKPDKSEVNGVPLHKRWGQGKKEV